MIREATIDDAARIAEIDITLLQINKFGVESAKYK
jgi:hypothetical protein